MLNVVTNNFTGLQRSDRLIVSRCTCTHPRPQGLAGTRDPIFPRVTASKEKGSGDENVLALGNPHVYRKVTARTDRFTVY